MKLLLIDGHYYAYRSFHAIRNLTNSRGEPTGAIYGFVKTLRRMIKDIRPDYAAVIWDMGLPERRVKLQPQYKQQRTEMPADMVPQLDIIQKIVPQLGFQSLGLPDTEADDLIASYAVAATGNKMEVVLATNDKDLFQLVNDHVLVYSTNKADLTAPHEFALLGHEHVVNKWGIPPLQIGEVLSLIGDTSDNIPGVDGLGVKTASAILRDHGPLDAILESPDRIRNERFREKIRASVELIRQNREMVRLDLDLPLPAAIDQLVITPDYPALIASLEACEFKSLLNEVKSEAGVPVSAAASAAPKNPAPSPAPVAPDPVPVPQAAAAPIPVAAKAPKSKKKTASLETQGQGELF